MTYMFETRALLASLANWAGRTLTAAYGTQAMGLQWDGDSQAAGRSATGGSQATFAAHESPRERHPG